MIYNTKTISCTVRAIHITQRQLESPGRQNATQLTIWNKALYYCTTTRTKCVPIVSIVSIRSDEGLTLETSAFRISVRWPIYIINSVDKTKFLYIVSKDDRNFFFLTNN